MKKAARSRLAGAIADTTLSKGVSQSYAKEIAAYLISERRVSELDSIMRDVQAAWANAGHVEVIASSAHPLTDAIKADIRSQITKLYPSAKEIIVTEVHDPEVMGGVRLTLAHQQLDLSVEAKLNKFKQLTVGKD